MLRLPNKKTATWKEKFYPETSLEQWHDWHWQLRNRIRDLSGLKTYFSLSEQEEKGVTERAKQGLPIGITPYYASLLDPIDASHGLRRTKIPVVDELHTSPGEVDDPLGEDAHRPVPGIVHTYPSKVLFLVTDFCATYCRYCTRSRMVGSGELPPRKDIWQEALDYIRNKPAIRDVLLSGGDPLMLSDERLDMLLSQLHAIPHVEMIRIGTKAPLVLPQRVTPDLVSILKKYHPVYMSLHIIHPEELTPEVEQASCTLADAGVPLGGQMVLLKGINDTPEIMKELCEKQLGMRIKPYYLHQCDAISGSQHFKTPVKKGLEMIQALHGFTSGYAVPHYMIDAPGGGGKVPVIPDYIQGRDQEELIIRSYNGTSYRYYDPL